MTQVIGHRGAPTVAPENTVRAFRAARELGADGVEFDVRRAAGGRLVVCHDEHLPDGRALRDLAPADLPASMCDLDAALDACAGAAVVNVEIKNWPGDGDFDETLAIAHTVAETLLARPAGERRAFLVSSFHLPTLDRARMVAPELATGWLTLGFADVRADLARLAERGHAAVHPHHGALDAEAVALAHEQGLAVTAWTCDDPERLAWLAGLGTDAVVTNEVAAAVATLARPVRPG